MTAASLELSLGPVSFYWTRERYFAFYEQACHWPLTSVTLGETVCSRRRDMKLADWLEIGHQLAAAERERAAELAARTAEIEGLRAEVQGLLVELRSSHADAVAAFEAAGRELEAQLAAREPVEVWTLKNEARESWWTRALRSMTAR